jgi:hypothetical protein
MCRGGSEGADAVIHPTVPTVSPPGTDHNRTVNVERAVVKAFGLEGDAWLRHANPWSVYTRMPIPALLVAAVWSRQWLGWWCLVPVAAAVLWMFVNPRAFPPPASLDHWASRAVLGERYWGTRKERPIPVNHRVAPWVLTVINAAGVPFVVWGVVAVDVWLTLFGLAVHVAGKTWFIDRMALLYDAMEEQAVSHPGSPPPEH